MSIKISNPNGMKLPPAFNAIIQQIIEQEPTARNASQYITINLRDPNYSVEFGGYHPVEISLRPSNAEYSLNYITDFSYQGRYYPQLEKEIDICFVSMEFTTLFGGRHKVESKLKFINLFLNNITDYYHMNAYTVTVNAN